MSVSVNKDQKAAKRRKRFHTFKIALATFVAACFAVLFLLPIILTITNSFMSESEINANYGMIFESTGGGYVSKSVNLKFIPDKVTLSGMNLRLTDLET